MANSAYQWVPFYEALADKLLTFSERRNELFNLMKSAAADQPLMKYFHFEREDRWEPRHHLIDPFSVMGVMNRRTTDANRRVLGGVVAATFDIGRPAPTQFVGIPGVDTRKSIVAGVDEVWDLFVLAMEAAKTGDFGPDFTTAFENANAISGNDLASITTGLFWIRPNVFMPLDGTSQSFVASRYGITRPSAACSGDEYIAFLMSLKSKVAQQSPGVSFSEVYCDAWDQNGNALEAGSSSAAAMEQHQRAAFRQWYTDNGGSPNSANTISSAIGKARLKGGQSVFAITTYDEIADAIGNSGLQGYFHTNDGDYDKMNDVFDVDPTCQGDDLKSGISYYLAFLKGDETSAPMGEGIATGDLAPTHRSNSIREKNILLYGTPGTGKTYSTVQYAVSIIEEKSLALIKAEDYDAVFARYLEYKSDGLVAFVTFHQSFGYEEFIEGIRPVVASEDKSEAVREIEYEVHDGAFKAFCDKAGTPTGRSAGPDFGLGKNPTVWKVSLEKTGDNPTRAECMENGHIRIGWDEYGKTLSDSTDYSNHGGSNVLNTFYNRMQIGDVVLSCYSDKTIDAIGVVTGEPEWHDEFSYYRRVRDVKWLAKGLNEDITDLNSGRVMAQATVYRLSVSVSDVFELLRRVQPNLFTQSVTIHNRVFIIDEINRGNISRIFGELITLIEPSKRIGAKEELRAILPYSGQNFGVPNNVYIIGTMNTADRSIALIDTASRRRFSFVEMLPKPSVLADVLVDNVVDVAEMLDTMNKRIAVLLDREHTIRHSYLLPLRSDPHLSRLAEIFEGQIVPLLQEYFYDDYEKIRLVLGDNQKPDDSTRFIVKKNDAAKLFGDADIDNVDYYEVNTAAFNRIDSYAYL